MAGDLTVSGLTTLSSGALNTGGAFNADGGLDVTGNVTINRDVNANGGSLSGSGTITDGGTGVFNITGGVFVVTSNLAIQTGVNITVGTLDISGSLDVSSAVIGITNNGGIIQLNGNITGDVFNLAGSLIGAGTITGNVTNDADMSPGFSPGALTIVGNLTLQSNSNLIIDIAELTTAGVDYDLLDVQGVINMAGTLTTVVDLTNYKPQFDDTFVPITYASKTGTFDAIAPAPGFGYEITYSATNFEIVTVAIPNQGSIAEIVVNEIVKFTDEVNVVEHVEEQEEIEEKEEEVSVKEEEEEEEKSNQTMVCS